MVGEIPFQHLGGEIMHEQQLRDRAGRRQTGVEGRDEDVRVQRAAHGRQHRVIVVEVGGFSLVRRHLAHFQSRIARGTSTSEWEDVCVMVCGH